MIPPQGQVFLSTSEFLTRHQTDNLSDIRRPNREQRRISSYAKETL